MTPAETTIARILTRAVLKGLVVCLIFTIVLAGLVALVSP